MPVCIFYLCIKSLNVIDSQRLRNLFSVSTENIAANENTKLRSVLVVTIGGIVAAASLAIIFFVLGGSISFG